MVVAQFTDTHIVAEGSTYFGCDTSRYLADAVAAVHGLTRRPDCVVVTGDLVNYGTPQEYERFERIMATLAVPYYVVPGNHDNRDHLRAALPARTVGGSRDAAIRFAVDDFAVRLIGIDANPGRPWPGAVLESESLAWLEATLKRAPERPTIVCVHHPPFRTGLHYLDIFGFRGARRLRRVLARAPGVGRVICGHIHCVKRTRWQRALVCSAPSTAPQVVPLLFMDRKIIGARRELPGFALHEWTSADGFVTTVLRRNEAGAYVPDRLPLTAP